MYEASVPPASWAAMFGIMSRKGRTSASTRDTVTAGLNFQWTFLTSYVRMASAISLILNNANVPENGDNYDQSDAS